MMRISNEVVRSTIDDTFKLADTYVRDNQHRIVDEQRIGSLFLPATLLVNPAATESTAIFLERNDNPESPDAYVVNELFMASRGIALLGRTKSDPQERVATGFGLARYKDGIGLKQYYEIPGSDFMGDLYRGSNRLVRVKQATGNVFFPKDTSEATKARVVNILTMMQRRLHERDA